MINKIASGQPLGAIGHDGPPVQADPSQAPVPSGVQKPASTVDEKVATPVAPTPQPLLRLEITSDREGRYVYTLTDRDTGRVVATIPREALAQLGKDPNYTAGAVVTTKA